MTGIRGATLVVIALLVAASASRVEAGRSLQATTLDAVLSGEAVGAAAEYERRAGFDLERSSLTFQAPGHAPCIATTSVERFPVDPRGGQALAFESTYYSEEMRFTGGFTFPWMGVRYANAFVSRQGFITFDTTGHHARTGTLERHWQDARVSVLFAELRMTAASIISWRQLDTAVVVTWQNVGESDFQAVLHADGAITFTYLRVGFDGHKVVGLSTGEEGTLVDLSASNACSPLMEQVGAPGAIRGYGRVFESGYDLEHTELVFAGPEYQPCVTRDVKQFPVDPLGGEAILFQHSWDSAAEVRFEDGFRFPFGGVNYTTAYINYNGFVTFDEPDTEVAPSLRSHFMRTRVSVLYGSYNLDLADSLVSWQQRADRVAITFQAVGGSDFQLSLHADGRISMTYLDVQDPRNEMVVGVSTGAVGSGSSDVVPCGAGQAPVAGAASRSVPGVSQAFADGFDLEGSVVMFSGPDYTPCIAYGVADFPVDPAGGSVLPFRHSWDTVMEVRFTGGFRFPFGGAFYTSAYVNYKGFLTFDDPDEGDFPSLRDHFLRPRISVLYSNLQLSNEETIISWKQADDHVTFTFVGMSESDFQLTLYADGSVSMYYLKVADSSAVKIVGISTGVTGRVTQHLSTVSANMKDGAGSLCHESLSAALSSTAEAAAPAGSAEIYLSGFDMEHTELSFAAPDYTQPCASWDVQAFPVDPRGGTVMPFQHSWTEFQHIRFARGFRFPFAGRMYSSAYINRKGFITFDSEDTDYSPSLRSHFVRARISALYSNLQIEIDSVVSWKQVGTERVAITFQSVSGSNFQVNLLADGSVTMTYLTVTIGRDVAVVGVSLGSAGKVLDMSEAATCPAAAAPLTSDAVPMTGMAQVFEGDAFNLEHTTLTLSRVNGELVACTSVDIDGLPVDPAGGSPIVLDPYDDAPSQVNFRDGFKFPFMGRMHSSVFVSRKGFIAFSPEDTETFPSLRSHFAHPRVSALYTDLRPSRAELETAISWKQLARSAAVTWGGVGGNEFQALLHEDGTIQLSYLTVGATSAAVVGVSQGALGGVADLSGAPSCEYRSRSIELACPAGEMATSAVTADGLEMRCSDGSSLICQLDGGAASCTVRSKHV
mmetsp:Transcript_44756/g.115862  ORF Transcript_44756/g.115862 Transcript_44756/m.115862 type:complete len:1110 (+) Transcript_44756:75-3404(+)